jgi:hypothetical protein
MIGVGVEGPSDLEFWRKYLHRAFPGRRFDVRNMKTREKLVAAAPRLLATFRDMCYSAGLIILDLDKNPCVPDVIELFDEAVRTELRKPLDERYLFLCVAIRKMECWFLADADAVTAVLPDVSYELPPDTSVWGVGKLRGLWKEQYGKAAALNKIDFAKRAAPRFSAERALLHSASLRIAWHRIKLAAARA